MVIQTYTYVSHFILQSSSTKKPYGSPKKRRLLRRTSEKLGEVASQLLRQLPMVSARSERALLSELERCQSDVAVSFVQKVRLGDFVEDMFFLITISFFSNMFFFHSWWGVCFG